VTIPLKYDNRALRQGENVDQFIRAEDWNAMRSHVGGYINVQEPPYNAAGDGVTDDTAAIQAAVTAAASASGGTVFFPPGTYKSAKITVPSSTGLTITGANAIVSWNASGAYFDVVGTLTGLTVENLDIRGDGLLASGHGGVRNSSGQTLTKITYRNLRISSVVIGLSVTSENGGSTKDILIEKNTISTLKGTDGGEGYGIHVAGAAGALVNARILGNAIDNAERHSIYIARGRGVVVSGNLIREHRKTINTGTTLRAAITVARTSDVVVSGNLLDECYDSAIMVNNAGGTTAHVEVAHNVISNPGNATAQIHVGATGPPTTEIEPGVPEGTPDQVVVHGNTIRLGAVAAEGITLAFGTRVTISDNEISGTSTAQAITIGADGDSGGTATYTDSIRVESNRLRMTHASGIGIRLTSDFCTSTARVELVNNLITATNPVYATVAASNPNIAVSGQVAAPSLTAGNMLRSLPGPTGAVESWGTAAPTAGTWAVGDHVRNTTPAVGQPKGWYCTVAGTPGTWVSEGNL
jgi:polygalacturonase